MERIAIIKYYIVAFSSNSSNIWSKSTKKKAKQIVSTFKSIRKEEQARRGRKIDPWPMNWTSFSLLSWKLLPTIFMQATTNIAEEIVALCVCIYNVVVFKNSQVFVLVPIFWIRWWWWWWIVPRVNFSLPSCLIPPYF